VRPDESVHCAGFALVPVAMVGIGDVRVVVDERQMRVDV
jgi:hypothetical protein